MFGGFAQQAVTGIAADALTSLHDHQQNAIPRDPQGPTVTSGIVLGLRHDHARFQARSGKSRAPDMDDYAPSDEAV
jgi:hypothetical protein